MKEFTYLIFFYNILLTLLLFYIFLLTLFILHWAFKNLEYGLFYEFLILFILYTAASINYSTHYK